MEQKRLFKLYDALKAQNYDVPNTYDEFEEKLTRKGNDGASRRHKLFDSLKSQGFDVPDTYSGFYSKLFVPVNSTTSRARGANEPEFNSNRVHKQPAKHAPASPVAKAKGTPLTAADKQRFASNVNGIVDNADASMQRFHNQMEYLKKNSGLQVKPVKLGTNRHVVKRKPRFNAKTGKMQSTYITESGNEFNNRALADLEQNAVDDYKHSLTVDGQLQAAYAERDRLNDEVRKRMEEIDNKPNQGFADFMRMSAAASTPGAGPVGEHDAAESKYTNDPIYTQLMAALRHNKSAITTLEDKKSGKINSFWHTLATTAANGYTFNDGMGEMKDVAAQTQAMRHLDSINKKLAKGEELTKEEKASKAVLDNMATNNAIQGQYGDQYGAWSRAGGMMANSLDFMKDLMLLPGSEGMAKGIYKKVANIGAKQLAKATGDAAGKAIAKKVARGTLKATGVLVGSHLAGAMVSNTTGIGHTAGTFGQLAAGDVTKDENGNYKIDNQNSVLGAFVEAERQQVRENGSEMFGAFIPGIGKVLGKGAGELAGKIIPESALSAAEKAGATVYNKMGLSKISNALTQVGKKDWYQAYRKMLRAGGYQGLPGEALEEYEGSLFDALTGHADDAYNDLTSLRNHVDIWLGCATMGTLLGAVPMAVQGYHTSQYYRYKHKTNTADKVASLRMTPEKWEPLREQIDATDNEHMADFVTNNILGSQDMPEQDKKAALDYVRNLSKMRGYNLAQANNADDTDKDEDVENMNASYGDGYDTTDPEEMGNAKAKLDVARQNLAQSMGIEDINELDKIIGDDPIRYVDEQKHLMAIEKAKKQDGIEGNDPVRHSEGEDEKGLQLVLDYANAKSAYEGMLQRVRDDIDSQIEQSNTLVDRHTNRIDGMIHPVTMKMKDEENNDKTAYVISGNLVLNDDSTINDEKSDNSIVIMDAEFGKLEMVSPSAILNAQEQIDPAQEKEEAANTIRDQYALVAADNIDGKIKQWNVGDTYQATDNNGNPYTIVLTPNEQGIVDNGDGTVNVVTQTATQEGETPITGGLVQIPKVLIQQIADEARRAKVVDQQQEEQQEVPVEAEQEDGPSMPTYNLFDNIVVRDENGEPIRGSIQSIGEDGIEIYTEEPLNGWQVQLVSPEELDDIIETVTDADGGPVWNRQEDAPSADIDEVVAEETGNEPQQQEASEEVPVQSALERIPKDDNGEPIYEQTDPDTAYDAIVEQTGGNETMAKTVADSMVSDMKASLDKLNKWKSKTGGTITQKIAAEKEHQAAVDQAKANLEHWQKIAGIQQQRKSKAMLDAQKEADERAKAAAEEAKAQAAAKEEKERKEHEAVEGVADWVNDTPQAARARGYRRSNGYQYSRQENIPHTKGKEISVKFTDKVSQPGHLALIEAELLQPSHMNGQPNVNHFIPEAQPKKRTDKASTISSEKIATNINPAEITSSITAYTGAPTINSRGETIQGNNRSAALKSMWKNHADQADIYKQYLMDHADEFGLKTDDIAKMKNPVLVNMVDVDDNKAIELGQYTAQDTESGGTERIKAKNTIQKMGEDMKSFANKLLESTDEEASFSQLIDKNGVNVLKWMNAKCFITNTQYASAFDSNGNLTAETVNDLKSIMYNSIFQGGGERLEEMFNKMPVKAQRAILATAYRDYDSPKEERMVKDIQESIMAFNELMNDKSFVAATNFKDARVAIEDWKRSYQFDDATGEAVLPDGKFSDFSLHLVAMYKGETQGFIQQTFNQLFDLIQGTQAVDLFNKDSIDNTPRSLADAINEALNINNYGQQDSNVLGGNHPAGQEGQQEGSEAAETGGPGERGTEPANADGRTGEKNISLQSSIEAAETETNTNPTDGQKEAGNYKKGHVKVAGFNISIEQPKGSVRSGKDANGKKWSVTMNNTYGYMTDNVGVDGDHLDVFLSNDIDSWDQKNVYVVDQYNLDGTFDEHKVMLGFNDRDEATDAYFSNYDSSWRTSKRKIITSTVPMDIFKKWIESSNRKTKPIAEYALVKAYLQKWIDENLFVDSSFSKFTEDSGKEVEPEGVKQSTLIKFAENMLDKYDSQTVDYPSYNAKKTSVEVSADKLYQSEKNWFHPETGDFIGFIDDANECSYEFVAHKDAQGHLKSVSIIKYHDFDGMKKTDSDKTSDTKNTETKAGGYTVEPVKYTTKRGKVLDMQLVKFADELSEKQSAAVSLAKSLKGWYDKKQGGFMMRSIEDAKKLTDAVLGEDSEALEDAKPLSLQELKETKASMDEFHGGDTVWSIPHGENKTILMAHRMQMPDGRSFIQSYSFVDGTSATANQVEKAHDVAKKSKSSLNNTKLIKEVLQGNAIMWAKNYAKNVRKGDLKTARKWYQSIGDSVRRMRDFKDVHEANAWLDNVLLPYIMSDEFRPDEPLVDKAARIAKKEEVKKNPSGNKLVTDEQYEELKKRMRMKLRGQMNMGIDPEILAIGIQMAVYHIEKGATKFTDYAKGMIEDMGDAIRPYLKAFYNGVRDMPEATEAHLVENMSPYEEVAGIDVANFDKPSKDILAQAGQIVAETEVEKQAEEANKKLVDERNARRTMDKKSFRPATQEDVEGNSVVYYDGEPTHVMMIVHKGEQLNAAQFSKPEIDRIYLTNGKDVKLEDLQVEDEKKETVAKEVNVESLFNALHTNGKAKLSDHTVPSSDVDKAVKEAKDSMAKKLEQVKEQLSKKMLEEQLEQREKFIDELGDRVKAGEKKGTFAGTKNVDLEATLLKCLGEREAFSEALDNFSAEPKKAEPAKEKKETPKKNNPVKEKKSRKKAVSSQVHIADLFDNGQETESETLNSNDNDRTGKEVSQGDRVQREGDSEERTRGENRQDSDGVLPKEPAEREPAVNTRVDGNLQEGRNDGRGNQGVSSGEGEVLGRPERSSGRLQGLEPEERKNTHNNHGKRGVEYAPKTVDARITANIEAIELAQNLLRSGEQAPPKQMTILRKFSGWGGLGKAFTQSSWGLREDTPPKKLRKLLGNEAYQQAVMSANSSFYTPTHIIDSLWDIATQLGFKGGNILEGSAGIGNILAQMPTEVSDRSNIHAVEIDNTAGGILSLLYPDAQVDIQGFEQTKIENGSIDLAITNVPFVTGLKVMDESGDRDLSSKFGNIHDFCIAKNVRKLRPGGIGIFITSSGTLDKSQKLRDWVICQGDADFIGAFRLNNNTFGGTSVTSDIIVIRKRVNGQKSANAIDVGSTTGERVVNFDTGETRKVDGKEKPVVKALSLDYNKYFQDHPEMMAGKMKFGFEEGDTYRPTSIGLFPAKGLNQKTMLTRANASNFLPFNI